LTIIGDMEDVVKTEEHWTSRPVDIKWPDKERKGERTQRDFILLKKVIEGNNGGLKISRTGVKDLR